MKCLRLAEVERCQTLSRNCDAVEVECSLRTNFNKNITDLFPSNKTERVQFIYKIHI